MAAASSVVTASAPGKVLITGGYLVLDPAFSGVVLSVSARFYSTVSPLAEKPKTPCAHQATVILHSPQVCDQPSSYALTLKEGSLTIAQSSGSPNPFVAATLRYSLSTLLVLLGAEQLWRKISDGFTVSLRADYQFYSVEDVKGAQSVKTGLGSSAALVASLTTAIFGYFGYKLPSSSPHAALPASSSSSSSPPCPSSPSSSHVLDTTTSPLVSLLHNVAQLAHCDAQGKVGSGFDISAAFFGNHQYVRFSPKFVENVMASPAANAGNCSDPELAALLRQYIIPQTLQPQIAPSSFPKPKPDEKSAVLPGVWDGKVSTFQLPPCLRLLLGCVAGGSQTPGMVRSVLAWRSKHPEEANALWSKLGAANDTIYSLLLRLHAASQKDRAKYLADMATCSTLKPADWSSLLQARRGRAGSPKDRSRRRSWDTNNFTEKVQEKESEEQAQGHTRSRSRSSSADDSNAGEVIQLLISLRDTFFEVRALLREMGDRAGVGIEPVEQTAVLDKTMSLPGVVMSGVPGAGGFDAIFALVIDTEGDAKKEQAEKEDEEERVREEKGGEKRKGKGTTDRWMKELGVSSLGVVLGWQASHPPVLPLSVSVAGVGVKIEQ